MELTIPAYAKAISDTLKTRQPRPASVPPAPHSAAPEHRPLGRLFRRRPAPTTYQRCLAVHMHFAQSASALD